MNILFVCTGNICRSPVAEHLLRDLAGGDAPGTAPAARPSVSSAGTAGLSGYAMDPRSVEYLRLRGIDGGGFTARRATRRMVSSADLVIGFEQEHVNECLRLAPSAMSRAFRLSQLAAWQRGGALGSLSDLMSPVTGPELRRSLPLVDGDLEDPVRFHSFDDYFRVLDVITADVTALSALLPVGV